MWFPLKSYDRAWPDNPWSLMPSACARHWQTFSGYNLLIIFNKPVCFFPTWIWQGCYTTLASIYWADSISDSISTSLQRLFGKLGQITWEMLALIILSSALLISRWWHRGDSSGVACPCPCWRKQEFPARVVCVFLSAKVGNVNLNGCTCNYTRNL